MAKALQQVNAPQLPAVPDYIQSFVDELGGSNIPDQLKVPFIGTGGKVWSMTINGDQVPLVGKDPNGDSIPLAILPVVILGAAERRARAYYSKQFDPDNPAAPDCWSNDGLVPHPNVDQPPASTCASCPNAAKGSGRPGPGNVPTAACSQHRFLAAVPAAMLDLPPLRLRVSVTSDYNKEATQLSGQWLAFQQYRTSLRNGGVPHTASVVTKLKFDPTAKYPRIMFAYDRYLTAAEIDKIKPIMESGDVQTIISGEIPGAPVALPPPSSEYKAKAPTPPPPASPPKQSAPKPQQSEGFTLPTGDDEGNEVEAELPPPKPKRTTAAKTPAKAEVEAVDMDSLPPALRAILEGAGE